MKVMCHPLISYSFRAVTKFLILMCEILSTVLPMGIGIYLSGASIGVCIVEQSFLRLHFLSCAGNNKSLRIGVQGIAFSFCILYPEGKVEQHVSYFLLNHFVYEI